MGRGAAISTYGRAALICSIGPLHFPFPFALRLPPPTSPLPQASEWDDYYAESGDYWKGRASCKALEGIDGDARGVTVADRY